MTSFYNNFSLNKNNNNVISQNIENTNILKKNFTLDYTDYEKLKISEQYNKLYSNIFERNKDDITLNENKKIYNLSLLELIKMAGPVYINLINDLSIYLSTKTKDKSLNKLGFILTKDDNLLYIGLLILVLSFFLWLIDILA
jgi:hypothetical protein